MSYNLQKINEEGIPSLLDGVTTIEQWNEKRERILQTWLNLVMELPEREQVKMTVISRTELEDHSRLHIRYNSANQDEVTAFLLLPKTGDVGNEKIRKPAMMALHPTIDNGKVDTGTMEGRANRRYGLELVQRGYVVLIPDTITAGERITSKAYLTAEFYRDNPG